MKAGKKKLDEIVENLKLMWTKKVKCCVMADNNCEAMSNENEHEQHPTLPRETSLNYLISLMQQINSNIVSSKRKLTTQIDALESELEA